MTDRPVADREPLSAEDAKNLREVVESQARLGHPMTIVPNDVLLRLLATLDAARAHPDEAGLREALGRQIMVLPTMEVGGTEVIARTQVFAAITRALAEPAVPVAGAEDWYDRDAKAFASAHAQTAALRAAQPEDDGLPDERAVATWPGGGGRVSHDPIDGAWFNDADGAWVVLFAPRQFFDGLRLLSELSEGVERRDP